jgi:hypothetical protein
MSLTLIAICVALLCLRGAIWFKHTRERQMRHMFIRLAVIAALLMLLCGAMRADLGLMLDEALKVGGSKWTGAGHSAVYLSGVCMASPLELRLCEPGENGVVLTNYRFGEDRSYEWNAIPLNVYLYGVEDVSARPIYASKRVLWTLQERYRKKYLANMCTGRCSMNPTALWRETVASTFMRDIYMFTVKTTAEQDHALIEKLNHAANVGHYNLFTHNCANFARDIVNTYFPGAAKADRVNDFWITSPKAIAKSFSHYGVRHPELEFHVVRFSQIPGEYTPSKDSRKGTEQLYRANRWRLPLAVLLPETLVLFASSYTITGRFNPELELRRRPDNKVIWLETKLREAHAEGNRDKEHELKMKIRLVSSDALGTKEEWSSYNSNVRQYETEAVARGYSSGLDSLRKLAKRTVSKSRITMDDQGGLWLIPRDGQSSTKIGLSASTLEESSSNAQMAYLLALSRVDAELRKKMKNRETLGFFREDWGLMEQLRGQISNASAVLHCEPAKDTCK